MQNAGCTVISARCVSIEPGMTVECSERTHREIAQPQIGVAAFFPDPEQRPVQRLAQQVVALAHGDADALAEIAAFDKGAAREGAAITGVRAIDPEAERDAVAEDEIDLAAPQRRAERIVVGI